MNTDHRELIIKNIGKLVDGTDVAALLPKLYEKGIFTKVMLDKYQNNKDVMGRNLCRDLYYEIQTRGPDAFTNLIYALHDSRHDALAALLDPNGEINLPRRPKRVHPTHLPAYLNNENPHLVENVNQYFALHPKGAVNLGTQPLKVQVKKLNKPPATTIEYKTNIYSMGSRPKGLAMIINIKEYNNDIKKERVGAEHDQKNLKELFEQLGYSVSTHVNLTAEGMMDEIKKFAMKEAHAHVDSCIMAILSHGEQDRGETNFVAADGKAIPVTSILELFSNEQCEHLRNKPKIFFFQSCRGDRKVHGIKGDFFRTKTDGSSEIPLRKYSDMLIAYSTVTGYESHRDIYLGTWYIQAVCEVFMHNACDTEISEMLKLVDNKLEPLISEDNTMQTTCFENRGFKTFFFNPGIYDDGKGD